MASVRFKQLVLPSDEKFVRKYNLCICRQSFWLLFIILLHVLILFCRIKKEKHVTQILLLFSRIFSLLSDGNEKAMMILIPLNSIFLGVFDHSFLWQRHLSVCVSLKNPMHICRETFRLLKVCFLTVYKSPQ